MSSDSAAAASSSGGFRVAEGGSTQGTTMTTASSGSGGFTVAAGSSTQGTMMTAASSSDFRVAARSSLNAPQGQGTSMTTSASLPRRMPIRNANFQNTPRNVMPRFNAYYND